MAPDTQWATFEVFLQERPDQPHKNVGSVHAPDAEVALQNARDVFVRRPHAHSVWVAPATRILARTKQELERDEMWRHEVTTGGAMQRYHVFRKESQRRSMVYVVHAGEVEASSPVEALRKAVEEYGGGPPVYVWWICPEEVLTRSQDEDAPSMFSPAETKTYRHPQGYRTVTMMKEVITSQLDEADIASS